MITTYVKWYLAQRGYTDVTRVYYSLGYSQGDGLCFEADFSDDDLRALARRLVRGTENFATLRAINKGISVQIRHTDAHYYHYNTIDAQGEQESDEFTREEEQAFDEFVAIIQEDARDFSKRMECHAYTILECTPYEDELIREYTTAQYIVRIERQREELNETPPYDEEVLLDEAIMAAEGRLRIFCLSVKVLDRETKDELGSAYLSWCKDDPTQPDIWLGGDVRDKVHEAIQEARSAIEPEMEVEREAA